MAVGGLGLSWLVYGSDPINQSQWMAKRFGVLFVWIKNKFYIDEVYLFITHKIIFQYISAPIAWFDRQVVDGAVNLSGWLTRKAGGALTLLQTGQTQTYGLWFVLGTVVTLIMLWFKVG